MSVEEFIENKPLINIESKINTSYQYDPTRKWVEILRRTHFSEQSH